MVQIGPTVLSREHFLWGDTCIWYWGLLLQGTHVAAIVAASISSTEPLLSDFHPLLDFWKGWKVTRFFLDQEDDESSPGVSGRDRGYICSSLKTARPSRLPGLLQTVEALLGQVHISSWIRTTLKVIILILGKILYTGEVCIADFFNEFSLVFLYKKFCCWLSSTSWFKYSYNYVYYRLVWVEV